MVISENIVAHVANKFNSGILPSTLPMSSILQTRYWYTMGVCSLSVRRHVYKAMRDWAVLSLADVPFTAARWGLSRTVSAQRLAGTDAPISNHACGQGGGAPCPPRGTSAMSLVALGLHAPWAATERRQARVRCSRDETVRLTVADDPLQRIDSFQGCCSNIRPHGADRSRTRSLRAK